MAHCSATNIQYHHDHAITLTADNITHYSAYSNKAVVDIRLRPGAATWRTPPKHNELNNYILKCIVLKVATCLRPKTQRGKDDLWV